VARPRLFERLDQGRHGRLILVCAPAGFGKTTLVTHWLAARAVARVAWLSLDEHDADPARFCAQLVAALQTVEPGIGQAALAVIAAPTAQTAAGWVREPMAALINELDELAEALLIVLDDYQYIASPAVHVAVQFLLDHMPPTCCLLLLTREDPPLALARLRARGQLTEIRADDLRFTTAEAVSFFNDTVGLALTPAAVEALAGRTEGWIAGLQLAALALSGLDDTAAAELIADFSGSHRYVVDYLLEEVLSRQPAEVRAFLHGTAALDRLCGPLCDAVISPLTPVASSPLSCEEKGERVGGSGVRSQSLLEHLDRASLFVIPLDGERRWYRYHRLFADFLRAELRRDEEREQHRRAAAWFAANGFPREAAVHALAAEDWQLAAAQIAAAAADLLRGGELITLSAWLAALPEVVLRADETLMAHRALTALLTGQLEEAGRWADALADVTASRIEGKRDGRSLTVAAWLASAMGRADLAPLAQQAVALTPDDDPFYRAVALIALGLAQNIEGNAAGADASFRQAYELAAATGQSFAALGALTNLCFNLLDEGRFREAEALAQEALARYVDRRGRPLPVLGILYVPLAVLAYARDDLSRAETYARTGLELCRRLFSRAILGGDAEMTLALILFARGDQEAAHALLAEARREAEAAGVKVVAERLELHDAALRLRAGDPSAVERHLARRDYTSFGGSRSDLERMRLLEARVWLARGQPGQAAAALAELSRDVAAVGHFGRLTQIRIWQAVAAEDLGDRRAALAALREALSLAAAEGYRRAFLDAGEAALALLPLVRDAATAFVDELLARQAPAASPAPGAGPSPVASPSPAAAAPVELLSARELEILRLIAAGHSNQAIADRLVITVGTAKWHVHNVLQKLGVTSRSQAIARARELGLL